MQEIVLFCQTVKEEVVVEVEGYYMNYLEEIGEY